MEKDEMQGLIGSASRQILEADRDLERMTTGELQQVRARLNEALGDLNLLSSGLDHTAV